MVVVIVVLARFVLTLMLAILLLMVITWRWYWCLIIFISSFLLHITNWLHKQVFFSWFLCFLSVLFICIPIILFSIHRRSRNNSLSNEIYSGIHESDRSGGFLKSGMWGIDLYRYNDIFAWMNKKIIRISFYFLLFIVKFVSDYHCISFLFWNCGLLLLLLLSLLLS